MSIIDSIQLSGSSYDVRDKSATTVVSLTQQEYDALPSSAKTANILYNITDATAGDLTQYWTSAQTQSAITEAVSGKQDTLSAGTNITIVDNVISAEGGGVDSGTVQTMIDESISGKADSSAVTEVSDALTAHTANTTVHITAAERTAWNAKSDFSGSYNDLTDKPTIPTVPTSNTAFTNDAGYITSGETQSQIDNSISGKVDTSAYTAYTAATDSALAGKADTATTYSKTEVDNAITAATSTKQDTLVSSVNIKTINNTSILGSGNIDIQGGGGTVSSAITSGDTNAVAGGAVYDAVVYSASTYNTELTFDTNGYAENWIEGQSAITIDVSGYTSDTRADYAFQDGAGNPLGNASIFKSIGSWWSSWSNNADNCTITTDGDTATTAIITDIPSGTVKIRRMSANNPPKAIISGDTPATWIKDALDDHRDNTTVHITAAERTSWNNKSNFSGSYNDLTDKPIPDSALNVASTNPVQNQALYSELRIDNESGETETTLTFEGYNATNYPNGCTKIKVQDITSNSQNSIYFFTDDGPVGSITVSNWGSISVDTSDFQAASYEISGSTVIISYPTATTVTRLDVSNSTKYTYKAITSSTTPLKDQVVANTTALGGLKLVKLTESEYAALVSKDANTLYVVIPDPS